MSKSTKSNFSGFTLVELIVVIVVIAILAAISIVAFNGVSAKSKTTSAKASASQVLKKAEIYQADSASNTYPAAAADFATNPTSTLDGGITIGTPDAANGQKTVGYATCGTPITGAKVTYWDYNTNAISTEVLTAGSGC